MKRLLMLVGMLAALLVLAVPAFGQDGLRQPKEISATGVIQTKNTAPDELQQYKVTDETTGATWTLISKASEGGVDLSQYVGERITIYGFPQTQGPVSGDADLTQVPVFVDRIDPTAGSGETPAGKGRIIYGTNGYDKLSGSRYGDFIYGLGGGDEILEGNGDDSLYGGRGGDCIVGGYGKDTLYGDRGGDRIDGGAGDDSVNGNAGSDYLDGGSGNDFVVGENGNDAVYGFKGSDDLYGEAGDDLLYAAGDGTEDRISGGPGYDVCVVGSEDTVLGGCEEVYAY